MAISTKRKSVTFDGKITGDCECFCWEVSKETYIEVCGQEDYDREIKYRKEDRSFLQGLGHDGEVNDDTFLLYPNDIMRAIGAKDKVKLTVTCLESENVESD